MEFQFNVNDVLPDPVSMVDEKLAPFSRRYRHDRATFSARQNQLKTIIDLMGEASTKAQNLKSPITSAIKLLHSDHRIYISKDINANNGLGAVVGIIKIGHKKLFVQDIQGLQYEVFPLCILDFYVHESRQRTGCGKILFEYMLKAENINVEQLAIDKPSHKFLSFLKKHYNLDKPIAQVNNFVIYGGFFNDLQAVGLVPKRGQRYNNPSTARPSVHLYKRHNNENNEYTVTKRQAMNCQSPVNQTAPQQFEQESTIQVQPMETTTSTDRPLETSSMSTDRSLVPTSSQATNIDVTLPPIAPRPPGRHSASRSQIGSSGSRWTLENSFASGATFPDAFNAERGLAARASAYSRYNSSRENSAPVIRTTTKNASHSRNLESFERISSGVRKRNLHLTSAGNPLQMSAQQKQVPADRPQPVQINQPTDINANQTDNTNSVNPSFLSSTGSYSVSQMYNTYYGKQRSLGTGWNVFGVPTGTGMLSTRKNNSRTFPY